VSDLSDKIPFNTKVKHTVKSHRKVGLLVSNLLLVLDFPNDAIRKLEQITDSQAAHHKTMLCVRYDRTNDGSYFIAYHFFE
jgi:hypothetical protein